MVNIVGVRFKKPGKIYFFDPNNLDLKMKDNVIVETARGIEYGEVMTSNRLIEEEKIVSPLKKVIRKATLADDKHESENKGKEKQAFDVCVEKIKKHKLDMKLIDVEYTFDNTKILFYFTADGRIDFRELVKELASIYKTRIELRQIGVRDEVKRIGGNGMCGRELCCCSFLNNFEPVSIKMAKEQNLSLNPSKISGNCGRLMCCLKYEHEVYEEKISRLPKIGALVKTQDGDGVVDSVQILPEIIRVKFQDGEDISFKMYNAVDIEIIRDAEKHENNEAVSLEELKELERLEKLEKEEKNNDDY